MELDGEQHRAVETTSTFYSSVAQHDFDGIILINALLDVDSLPGAPVRR